MDNPQDWRGYLTAAERYDSIEKLQKALAHTWLGQDAFTVESKAYTMSRSRAEYDAACQIPWNRSGSDLSNVTESPAENEVPDGEPGTRIGRYQDCRQIADGVTAVVYRSGVRALKVIVETRDMEPHNPAREAKILAGLKPPCIPLLETFRDQDQRFVLVFPYMPLTLASLLDRGAYLSATQLRTIFRDLLGALANIHAQGIIHRDVKPSAVLLASPDGPAYLSDFGTAWHPSLSAETEPPNRKILDIGTGPYRAPEVLFGDRSYGPPVDMWAAGAMLAECCRPPPSSSSSSSLLPALASSSSITTGTDTDGTDGTDNTDGTNSTESTDSTDSNRRSLFYSPPTHEDGSQLGLILSIFKTLGSPTRESWPEAARFRTPPYDMYRTFPARQWREILPNVDEDWRNLIARLVRYNKGRATAFQALRHSCLV